MEIQFRTQLPELLKHFGLHGHALECGVAEGRNAQMLIQSEQITKLYLIDAWQHLEQSGDGGYEQQWHDNNYKEVLQRTAKFKEKRVILKGLSSEMIKQIPDDSLIFAYVDAHHSYQGCYQDLLNIYPKMKVGGIISCHDYLNLEYGVNKAVKDFISQLEIPLKDVHVTEENGDKSMVSCWFVKNR